MVKPGRCQSRFPASKPRLACSNCRLRLAYRYRNTEFIPRRASWPTTSPRRVGYSSSNRTRLRTPTSRRYPLNQAKMPKDERSNKARYAEIARHLAAIGETLLVEWWGKRCPDFEASCECCKRWKALDLLVKNPFEDD